MPKTGLPNEKELANNAVNKLKIEWSRHVQPFGPETESRLKNLALRAAKAALQGAAEFDPPLTEAELEGQVRTAILDEVTEMLMTANQTETVVKLLLREPLRRVGERARRLKLEDWGDRTWVVTAVRTVLRAIVLGRGEGTKSRSLCEHALDRATAACSVAVSTTPVLSHQRKPRIFEELNAYFLNDLIDGHVGSWMIDKNVDDDGEIRGVLKNEVLHRILVDCIPEHEPRWAYQWQQTYSRNRARWACNEVMRRERDWKDSIRHLLTRDILAVYANAEFEPDISEVIDSLKKSYLAIYDAAAVGGEVTRRVLRADGFPDLFRLMAGPIAKDADDPIFREEFVDLLDTILTEARIQNLKSKTARDSAITLDDSENAFFASFEIVSDFFATCGNSVAWLNLEELIIHFCESESDQQLLRDWVRMEIAEISEKLSQESGKSVSEETVRQRKHRAMKKLETGLSRVLSKAETDAIVGLYNERANIPSETTSLLIPALEKLADNVG